MIMSGDVVNRPSNCSGNAEHMARIIIAASKLNISTIPVSFLIAYVSFFPQYWELITIRAFPIAMAS